MLLEEVSDATGATGWARQDASPVGGDVILMVRRSHGQTSRAVAHSHLDGARRTDDVLVLKLPMATVEAALPSAAFVGSLPGSPAEEQLRDVVAWATQQQGEHASDAAYDEPSTVPQHLDNAKRFIEENLTNSDLTPELIATSIFISPRYLHVIFKAEGISVSRYVMARRLERARERLLDPRSAHLSIAALSSMLGFKDPSHFSRVFRAAYELTPREFRTRHKHKPKARLTTGSASCRCGLPAAGA